MTADVFCLVDGDGRLLPPPVQSTILAKYSRSPLSAKEILLQLTKEDADKFQDRYVVNFGHSSVAELAQIPICFEGISIIASKFIESWQRAGYSEKSTRYQKFDRNSFITPPNGSSTMKEFAAKFYTAYDQLYPKVLKHCADLMNEPFRGNETKQTVKARAFDNIRYLLPAGTGTNVACVINMRDASDMIAKLKGHINPEFKMLGNKMQESLMQICPVLVRHTEPNHFQFSVNSIGDLTDNFDLMNPKPYVQFFKPNIMANNDLEQTSFAMSIASMYDMNWHQFEELMDKRPEHSEVPDLFKTIKVTFEVMMDYGAFRDLQRHRRCEQFVEFLTTNYGYVIPNDIIGTNLENEYKIAMELINDYNDENVVYDRDINQYMIPLGYLHRSVFQMDLKELYYIVELRTKPHCHPSYAKIAYRMYELAKNRWPKLMKWCKATKPSVGLHV